MQALLDVVRVLFDPQAVFERVRERPQFLAPFAALAAAMIVIGYFTLPFQQAAMATRMAELAQRNPDAAAAAGKFAWVGLIVVPIVFGIVLALSGALLWVLVSVVGAAEAKFATLLSVVTYTAVTAVLTQAVGLVVLHVRGMEAVATPQDLRPALGLDLLAPDATGFVGGILNGINPFSLWGMVLTAIGVYTTHRLSKGIGYTVAGVQFALSLAVAAALGSFATRG